MLQNHVIEQLYGMEAGSYNLLFGSVELPKPEGEPKVFVIAGAGCGIPVYRALQKKGIPFATGILFENDVDFQVARALSSCVVSASAFEEITDEQYRKAAKLVLVSFSCTAPIVGLLLVQTVTSGDWLAPAVGMFGFALALAVPFSLFAMFPTLMKKSPKSGSWMDQIKVVLGFIELAFALKFFSVADLAYGWHLMDREVFLSLWIVIFGALGAYLVGWLKFRQDAIGGDLNRPMSVPAIMLGLCSFAFAIYMIPGLWGAPCKAVSAFAPPMNTQDFKRNKEAYRHIIFSYHAHQQRSNRTAYNTHNEIR